MSLEKKIEEVTALASKAYDIPCQFRCYTEVEGDTQQTFWCCDLTFRSDRDDLLDYSGACGMGDTIEDAIEDLMAELRNVPQN